MIYLSIDIETTGLNPDKHDILEFGCILEDTTKKLPLSEIPQCRYYFDLPIYKGDPYALALNSNIFKKIMELRKNDPDKQLVTPIQFIERFGSFLKEYLGDSKRINVAGKNYNGFDKQFLQKIEGFNFPFGHRVLDPAMLYVDWNEDKEIPSTEICYKRAAIESNVAHTTIEDAWGVIELLRKTY